VTLEPLTDQLDAAPGVAFSAGGAPSLISGSIMLYNRFADVVSVARPGSSDGGSAPIAIRITCALASLLPVTAVDAPVTVTAIRPTRAAQRKRLRILTYPSLNDVRFPPLEPQTRLRPRAAKGLDRSRFGEQSAGPEDGSGDVTKKSLRGRYLLP